MYMYIYIYLYIYINIYIYICICTYIKLLLYQVYQVYISSHKIHLYLQNLELKLTLQHPNMKKR